MTNLPVHGGDLALWSALRRHTQARIGLGRAGAALPTRHRLELQAAHAAARDAVHSPFAPDTVAAALPGTPTVRVRSAAPDRLTYLQRPDLGRRLHPTDRAHLPAGEWDVVFVIADGLSSRAVHEHAAAVVHATAARLDDTWRLAPVVLAEQARVALGDDIAHAMGAAAVVVLVGERPGMSAADSLGAYLTHAPQPGITTDAHRNCLSNIRPPLGLPYETAATKLTALLTRARELGHSGVDLKDETALTESAADQLPR
ncbi:ethanolamine ammonia-lyase small subunit [Streptomyces lincolnensis]|uniref:Ethanolamine ammonia-lyase small subunit n=1 Tax=Streptomyces lincolnensis TaxID=1915 RepID=A0A1B1MEM7_STRLN|nr:ethanolamine ammonia-lyase subunit EutC [Streptomyces lincolnensis]ANS66842.1 ethanolamine ammonia-lyase small subunit [Streptomyces lincolnensis]AXG55713.1 ethanolamine ammonia-lyase small subunit [Streptomyces lincolnensis]QMV07799.1 ethanolamine ammonia-lyase subunit EutC [Streptomyces lincolnensis]